VSHRRGGRAAPGDAVARIERTDLPTGEDERFAGYGIMAQPFRSGHVLALRRFPHNTIGGEYTSVWHCDPSGDWTMWNDADPLHSCPRYFGPALASCEQREIDVEWIDGWTVRVRIDGVLDWNTTIAPTGATRMMTTLAGRLPDAVWRNRTALGAMGRVAGVVLGAGAIRFHGTAPSRQQFRVRIPQVWATREVSATLGGEDLGPAGRADTQRWLGGFALPNRGLFAVGQAVMETYDDTRHVQVVTGVSP
jgi:hypothetical protein